MFLVTYAKSNGPLRDVDEFFQQVQDVQKTTNNINGISLDPKSRALQATFGYLGPDMQPLDIGKAGLCQFQSNGPGFRVLPLISCAAVIYSASSPDTDPAIWIHHAPSGLVKNEDIEAAVWNIRSPVESIRVIYAHPNSQDAGYLENISTLVSAGISTHNIIEIHMLTTGCFGINSNFHIGI